MTSNSGALPRSRPPRAALASPPQRPWRALIAAPIPACLLGALAIAAVEIVALGRPSLGLIAVCLSLHLALGLAIGAVLSAQEALLRRWPGLRRGASWLYALGALPALAFVAAHLFDGAQAAKLPGAALGHLWLPVLGVLAAAAAIALARRLRRRLGAAPGALLLALSAALVEYLGRTLYPSEYADVHAFLVALACLLAALSVRVAAAGSAPSAGASAAPPSQPAAASRLVIPGLAGAVVAALIASLVFGLADKDERLWVATHGTDLRHLVRVARLAFDRDGDGAAVVLGGGDCDDGDPAISPTAPERPGNGIDEDCDGRDLEALALPASDRDWDAELAAWARAPALEHTLARTRDMNILVVAVDTLRADALALPGDDDAADGAPADGAPADSEQAAASDTPHLDALLADAAVFRHAYATGAGTDISVSSTITGHISPFEGAEITLAEALRATGRATAAVFPTEVLRYAGQVLLGRGIDRLRRYVNDRGQRDVGSYTTSAETTRMALATIDAMGPHKRPFFLWTHYFDVHEHAQVLASDPTLARYGERFELGELAGKYRALVALTDAEIGRLFEELRARDLWDQTIIVLLSDHGESMGEDPRLPLRHGRFVYNALTHVPLVIRVPGATPRVVDAPVSVVDLMPTLLTLVGAELPPGLDGRSLLPLFLGSAPGLPPRPVAMSESEQSAVIVWPYKLLLRPADNLVELYDLASDPAEQRDLAEQQPQRVSALRAIMAQLPQVEIDRTRRGRRARDARSRAPRARTPAP